MKKKLTLFVFPVLLFLLSSPNLSSANSDLINNQNKSFENNSLLTPQFKLSHKMKVVPDSYGGLIYSYEDNQGKKCVSNNISSINGGILMVTADTASVTDVSDEAIVVDDEDIMDDFGPDEPYITIADPFEPVNRIFFHFNDKLYFWFLKPAATGYKAIVPEPARTGIRDFFNNLSFPIRFVNCIFQGKFDGAGYEFGRFLINSTLGVAGFSDPALKKFNMPEYDEDLGQTLGSFGLGHGFFINWPFLGPSSVLDTVGSVGDAFLEPINYIDVKTKYDLAIKGIEEINKASLGIGVYGQYEDLKKSALDPYIAVRDAYFQYRRSQTEK